MRSYGKKLFRALRASLPRHAGSRSVLRFFELLRRLRRPFAPRTPLPSVADTTGSYIEDQSLYPDLPFGRSTVARAGCEAIALRNALLALEGSAPPLETVIASLSRDGMVFAGRFGAAPGALRDYLRRRGYRIETVLDPEALRSADVPAAILTFWNDRSDVASGVHTICATRTGNGYIPHNLGLRPGPDASLERLLPPESRLICAYLIAPRSRRGVSEAAELPGS